MTRIDIGIIGPVRYRGAALPRSIWRTMDLKFGGYNNRSAAGHTNRWCKSIPTENLVPFYGPGKGTYIPTLTPSQRKGALLEWIQGGKTLWTRSSASWRRSWSRVTYIMDGGNSFYTGDTVRTGHPGKWKKKGIH